MKIAGWGRYPIVDAPVVQPRNLDALLGYLNDGPVIARGNGRAYGDSSVSRYRTVQMGAFDRMIAFDNATGVLVAEAGVLLADVIKTFLPRGWFPAVTPGTKFVTLGGMVAADVHGKNHHKDGSFGSFVEWIELIDAEGNLRRCSSQADADLFGLTIGGMGLTGVILRVAVRLRRVASAWIRQKTIPARNIDAAIDVFEETLSSTYSVAWIDCLSKGPGLGRSLIMLGEHAELGDLDARQRVEPLQFGTKKGSKTLSFDFPTWVLNKWSVKAFNTLYYQKGLRNRGTAVVDWDSYFYPLDSILGWNKIYGRNGFMQFQCALPLETSRDGMRALISEISSAGEGSFLAVLKRLGPQESRISFPTEGYTLALDFPVRHKTLQLMNRLDEITLAHGGRFYLAKDSRMSAQTLRQSDDRVAGFVADRQAAGFGQKFQSAQSERLEI
ncbi:MAG: FAD-binding oxidoreductase [Pseudomonadota bacterium]